MNAHAASTFLDRIDVVILTWNEEANLARTLDALSGFPRVVVLDSGSTDDTLRIAARYPAVRVESHAFEGHAAQWNHALADCGLRADWVLAIDADYILSPALVEELASLRPEPDVNGYRAAFRYCIAGTILGACMYPPSIVLFRRGRGRALQDGHAHRIVVEGAVRALRGRIVHDDRKPLSRWLSSQLTYAQLECKALRERPWRDLNWQDRLRRMIVITPWLVPLYCLIVGRGLFDGWPGVYYALQRAVAESILSLKLLEARVAGKDPAP